MPQPSILALITAYTPTPTPYTPNSNHVFITITPYNPESLDPTPNPKPWTLNPPPNPEPWTLDPNIKP